jgi:hypothetical protein
MSLRAFLLKEEQDLAAYGLIFLVGFSALGSALSFLPANGDDLVLWSSVANAPAPLKYFIGDWGFGNNAYRPLHSLTIWLSYTFFGLSAVYNQLFNLILHVAIICLLYHLIRRVQPDRTIAFLMASLALISIYTVSPATWVSDRPTLFVVFFFILLLNHLYKNGQPNQGRISYIVILSILALLSKESGLILPLFAIYHAISLRKNKYYCASLITISITIIAAYLAFRLVIFGSNTFSNAGTGSIIEIGFYFGNVVKNLIGPFIPIFDDHGGLLSVSLLIKTSPFWMVTLPLVILSTRRELSALQKVALVIIVLNSLVHFSLFRYRIQYPSQLAIGLFIGTSPLFTGSINRKMILKGLGTALLLFSVFWVNRSLQSEMLIRYQMLNNYDLEPIVETFSFGIDPLIITRLLQHYKQ